MKLHPKKEPNNLAQKIIDTFKKENDVLAIFLSGSTIKGGTDIFSDVDINLVVKDSTKFKNKLIDFLSTITDLKFYFTPPNLNYILVCYLANLYKFDFGVYEKEQIPDNIPTEAIIQDKLALLQSKNQKSNLSTIANYDDLAKKYVYLAIADIIAVSREIYRKDIFEARANLDEARSSIATYINLKNHNLYFGFDQFEKLVSKEIRRYFVDSLKDNDNFKGTLCAAVCLIKIIKILDLVEAELIESIEKRLFDTM